MTYTEPKSLPFGVGDDVSHYDDGLHGHPKKMAYGKVIEIGEHTFLVKWDDLPEETEYEWQKVTIEGNQIIEHHAGFGKEKYAGEWLSVWQGVVDILCNEKKNGTGSVEIMEFLMSQYELKKVSPPIIEQLENLLNPQYENDVFTWHKIKLALKSL